MSALATARAKPNASVLGSLFDIRRWPLLVLRYPVAPNLAFASALYSEWDGCLARGPHALLVDLGPMNPIFADARLRKVGADAVRERRAIFEKQLIAEARVVPSTVVRHVVTAFDWWQGDSFSRPLRNLPDFAQAETWLIAELEKRGFRVPPT